jgi:AcrR family transcriptional regulator
VATPALAAVADPQTAKGQATRARLLAAAREEAIAEHGNVEIAAVAERAGVVPSLVHRYFGAKAGLVSALIEDFFDSFHAEVLDSDPPGEWAERERERVSRNVRFHFADPFVIVLYGRLVREPGVAQTEAVRIDGVIEAAAGHIRQGQKEGAVAPSIDPRLAGAAIFGATQRVICESLLRSPRPAEAKVAGVLWRQVSAAADLP